VVDIASFPTVTVDYYNIRINGRIAPTSEFTDTSVSRLLTENGLPGIAGAQYFANAADTRTSGFDIVVHHGVLLGREGLLQLVGGYNQTRTRATDIRPTPPELQRFLATLFGRTQRGAIERGQPDRTFALTTDFSFRRMTVDIHNQRFGRTALLDAVDPANDQTDEPRWITDTGFSYKITPRLSASATVANLFDVYPSEWVDYRNGVNANGLSVAGNFRYAVAISPFGANGRTIYVHLTYR